MVTVTVGSNASIQSRSGAITIGGQQHTVAQNGAAPEEQLFQATISMTESSVISLAWPSTPGEEYTVELSTDMIVWLELADGIAAVGEITTFMDDVGARGAIREGYYRVRDGRGFVTKPVGFRTETITKTGEPNVPPSYETGPGNSSYFAANLGEKISAVGQMGSVSGAMINDPNCRFCNGVAHRLWSDICFPSYERDS